MHPKQPAPGTSAAPRSGEARGPPLPGDGLQNVAMGLGYEGGFFQGWQIQPHGETVQGRLEWALGVLTGQETKVYGSGRTDSGVHALAQVANFRAPQGLDLARLRTGLNALGAPAIAVQRLVPVPEDFHARHSAIGKTYRYHIFNRAYPPVFGRGRCWWVRSPLDVPAMREAGETLLGTHDFSAFRAKDCAARSPRRTLEAVKIEQGDWPDATLRIEMRATGFLQHMARIIAGTLVAVGRGKFSPGAMPALLAGRRREDAGQTAPGRGLYLVQVRYDLQAFPELGPLLLPPPPGE